MGIHQWCRLPENYAYTISFSPSAKYQWHPACMAHSKSAGCGKLSGDLPVKVLGALLLEFTDLQDLQNWLMAI
jgi:hypothetical protein